MSRSRFHIVSTVAPALAVSALTGCIPSYEAMSAGQVGCAQSEISIENLDSDLTSETWIATCHGARYVCSKVRTGGGSYGNGGYITTSQVNCAPEHGASAGSAYRGGNDSVSASTTGAGRAAGPGKEAAETSTAPLGAAGFAFGATLDDTGAACTQAGKEWNNAEGHCSGTPTDIGIPASVRVRTCDGRVCVIEIQPNMATGLGRAFLATRDALAKKYGAPQSGSHNSLPSECASSVAACLESGRATLEFIWKFRTGETINLAIRKESQDSPSASMRLRYSIPPKTVRVNSKGL